MTFILLVVCLILLFAWIESKNILWKELASSYSTKSIPSKFSKAESLSFWNDDGVKSWFNHVHIEILDSGIAIYLPFFKRYIPSILVPWKDIEVRDKVFIGALARFRVRTAAKQDLYIKNKGIHLAIPYSYHSAIEQRIKSE